MFSLLKRFSSVTFSNLLEKNTIGRRNHNQNNRDVVIKEQ